MAQWLEGPFGTLLFDAGAPDPPNHGLGLPDPDHPVAAPEFVPGDWQAESIDWIQRARAEARPLTDRCR